MKAIVEAHDGTITVTSESNVGTSFVISLPLGDQAGAGQQSALERSQMRAPRYAA